MAKKSDKNVGYGRPPLHSRFKPGRSGNPRGRPKGRLNFATDLKNTLGIRVTLNHGGKPRRVTTQQAALLCLMEKALKAKDTRALEKLLGFAAMASGSAAEEPTKSLSAEDQAILDAYRAEIRAEARDDEDDDGGAGDT
ncbi:hypothetical protein IVB27_01915 [Bradyrhizobium sp. 197]|uniref:DUF5681 domain-containing protein n=1 Tax=Bradyrhizobium sp. 197 TaxID=2782663 RepID=UPI001FF91DF5|nr:DUF5681 domain-containing protein [Bradyrhizobium sp. 197]MCK1473591.1 hypothetical protein [Bradyrhizobium sp. 197]